MTVSIDKAPSKIPYTHSMYMVLANPRHNGFVGLRRRMQRR